jgi:hypothetical protein
MNRIGNNIAAVQLWGKEYGAVNSPRCGMTGLLQRRQLPKVRT